MWTDLEAVGVVTLITAVTQQELSLVIISPTELTQLSTETNKPQCTIVFKTMSYKNQNGQKQLVIHCKINRSCSVLKIYLARIYSKLNLFIVLFRQLNV